MLHRLMLTLSLLAIVACSARPVSRDGNDAIAPSATSAHDSLAPLGSETNPVLARGPFGEREYLRRLRCADGSAPEFERGGSVGEGSDGHILDVYTVTCPSGGDTTSVYMDMYHNDARERRAVAGFTVLPELPARMATGCPPQVGPTPDSSARYVFNYLEVETPAKAQNLPAGPIETGFKGYARVGFVIETTGRPEPGSLEMPEFTKPEARAAAERVVLGLRFTPAEHHRGCLVRQGTGVQLEFK